jgi:hypothetical protein
MPAALQAFINHLDGDSSVDFSATMALISELYDYRPTTFHNGLGKNSLTSEAGTNEGSCKIFAFGRLKQLSKEQTLACFGEHYRKVLDTPAEQDHGNIRRFMADGWEGIRFEGEALRQRS